MCICGITKDHCIYIYCRVVRLYREVASEQGGFPEVVTRDIASSYSVPYRDLDETLTELKINIVYIYIYIYIYIYLCASGDIFNIMYENIKEIINEPELVSAGLINIYYRFFFFLIFKSSI